MTIRSPLFLGLAALALTACAMAVARPSVGTVGAGADPEFRCVLDAVQQGGMVAYDAVLVADRARIGQYDLTVRGADGQVQITQTGPFSIGAGQTVTLGMAQVSGRAADYRAAFSLTSDGRVFSCPTRS